METNLNYDESVRTVKFTLSNINPNETKIEMRLSDNTVIEKGEKQKYGRFYRRRIRN